MTSDIRALKTGVQSLFEITPSSANNGCSEDAECDSTSRSLAHELFQLMSSTAPNRYEEEGEEEKGHSDSFVAPPFVVAQAAEMVAELTISDSNYDLYAPGHALYGWAKQKMDCQNRVEGPQIKRRTMIDPRAKTSSHPNGASVSNSQLQSPSMSQPTLAVQAPSRPRVHLTETSTSPASTQATSKPQPRVHTTMSPALLTVPTATNVAKPRLNPAQDGHDTAADRRPVMQQKQHEQPQRSMSEVESTPTQLVVGAAHSLPRAPVPPSREAKEEKEPQAEPMLVLHREEEQKSRAKGPATAVVKARSTVLRDSEIADLERFHDNSLAVNSKKAYLSDYHSFLHFMEKRFPDIAEAELQTKCTLEHVLAYLNQQCNDGKKITTINRRLSTIKKHILPCLFHKASVVPGSRDEQIGRELDAIVRGMRRTVGAEHRIRGKRPLLIENIIAMCEVAGRTRNDDGDAMPNTRCRDVCLLLFLFFSAMRRSEVEALLWSDLTFEARGVVVRIRQSKTDQGSNGQTIAISRLDNTERAAFCPVKALEAWRETSRGEGDSPVFRWVSKRDVIQWRVLIDQRIVAIIKWYAAAIGLDSRCFAAHSTRSGFVTSSSDQGVPISSIMKRTRHKSLSTVSVYMKSDELFSSSGDRKL